MADATILSPYQFRSPQSVALGDTLEHKAALRGQMLGQVALPEAARIVSLSVVALPPATAPPAGASTWTAILQVRPPGADDTTDIASAPLPWAALASGTAIGVPIPNSTTNYPAGTVIGFGIMPADPTTPAISAPSGTLTWEP